MNPMSHDDAARLIAALAADTEHLIGTIEAETAALHARDMASLSELSAAKASVAAAWEKRILALARLPGGIAALTPDQQRAVRALSERLEPIADENARLLSIAVEAGRRTMASVAEAAKSLAPGPDLYGRDGTHGRRAQPGAPTGVAVSFDQSL